MQYWARISRREQPQEDAHSGNTWLCKAEMETRFGVRLTSAMLNSGQMKKMLSFAKHSMDKDICLYKRPNIVDETLGSTDMKPVERFATIHSRPLAVGAGVGFCYQSSDSFVALNDEATQDSTSSSHRHLQ